MDSLRLISITYFSKRLATKIIAFWADFALYIEILTIKEMTKNTCPFRIKKKKMIRRKEIGK